MNTPSTDTIAAMATAPGEAGIAIIRISGPNSLPLADRIFKCKGPPPSERSPHTVIHGFVQDENQKIDEVILLIMRAPHSYTKEDVVEIQCHGGHISAKRILRVILNTGVRLAQPGEFTKRAFLNGRLDLLQAEAVLDLIRAQSDRSATAAIEQLDGRLSNLISTIYDTLVRVNADLEVSLDFSEDDITPVTIPQTLEHLEKTAIQIKKLLDTWDEGHLLRDGALVVISGRPNVGKSTLLNSLLGKERAIVSPKPGTTRDTIEEVIILEGIPIRLVDTAGLRASPCDIEQEGIKRAKIQMEKADIQIYIIDASQSLNSEDQNNMNQLNTHHNIIVLNKIDLPKMVHGNQMSNAIEASFINGNGINELKQIIINKLGLSSHVVPHAVISERHRDLLIGANRELHQSIQLLKSDNEQFIVPAIYHLKSAIESIGRILGRAYYDDLLDSIFNRFCIGK